MSTCCDHLVIIVNGLDELKAKYSTASQFYMYLFINIKPREDPAKVNIHLENIIIFQKVTESKLFTVYERKRNQMKKLYL